MASTLIRISSLLLNLCNQLHSSKGLDLSENDFVRFVWHLQPMRVKAGMRCVQWLRPSPRHLNFPSISYRIHLMLQSYFQPSRESHKVLEAPTSLWCTRLRVQRRVFGNHLLQCRMLTSARKNFCYLVAAGFYARTVRLLKTCSLANEKGDRSARHERLDILGRSTLRTNLGRWWHSGHEEKRRQDWVTAP